MLFVWFVFDFLSECNVWFPFGGWVRDLGDMRGWNTAVRVWLDDAEDW